MAFFCSDCRTWQLRGVRARTGGERGCSVCFSLERHRMLGLLLPLLVDLGHVRPLQDEDAPVPGIVLDVAPCVALDPVIGALPGLRPARMDFDPGADGRIVDLRASLTQLPFGTGDVSLLLCSHVLEHVPEDKMAMQEITRVLAPDGLGVILVPQRPGTLTDEDPDTSPEERLRRFGQSDHVRMYGDDFDGRLVDAGLQVRRITAGELFAPDAQALLRIGADEPFWLVRRVESELPLPEAADLVGPMRQLLGERFLVAVARTQAEHDALLALQERNVRALEGREEALKQHETALRNECSRLTALVRAAEKAQQALCEERDVLEARHRALMERHRRLRNRKLVRLMVRIDRGRNRLRAALRSSG